MIGAHAANNGVVPCARMMNLRVLGVYQVITSPLLYAAIMACNEEGLRLPKSNLTGVFNRYPAASPYSGVGPMSQVSPPIAFRSDRVSGAFTVLHAGF